MTPFVKEYVHRRDSAFENASLNIFSRTLLRRYKSLLRELWNIGWAVAFAHGFSEGFKARGEDDKALLTAARDEIRTGHAQGALVQAVQAIEGEK